MADMGWSRYIAGQEAAHDGACFAAAEKHGVKDPEDCDDGDRGCPECPWKKDCLKHPENVQDDEKFCSRCRTVHGFGQCPEAY